MGISDYLSPREWSRWWSSEYGSPPDSPLPVTRSIDDRPIEGRRPSIPEPPAFQRRQLSEKARGKLPVTSHKNHEVHNAGTPADEPRATNQANPQASIGEGSKRMTVQLLRHVKSEESFGLLMNDKLFVVNVDADGPAQVASLRPLDLIIAVDDEPTSSRQIGAQVSGRSSVQLTILRPANSDLSRIAAEQNVREWTEWEKAVVACAMGDTDALFEALHILSRLQGHQSRDEAPWSERSALLRTVTAQESAAIHASYGFVVRPGSRIDEIATTYGQSSILALLEGVLDPLDDEGSEEGQEEEAEGGDLQLPRRTAASAADDWSDEGEEEDDAVSRVPGRPGIAGDAGDGGGDGGSGRGGGVARGPSGAAINLRVQALASDLPQPPSSPLRAPTLQRWSGGSASSGSERGRSSSRRSSLEPGEGRSRAGSGGDGSGGEGSGGEGDSSLGEARPVEELEMLGPAMVPTV